MLSDKNVLIGITAGIAAYKICSLIRKLKQMNANVKVVCTPNALNFVTKLTLQNLSQNEVYVQEFDVKDWKPEHISFADESDIMVIAPASANTIAKIANGIADNLLTSIACAYKKKIIIAPAMNVNMWNNPATQNNLKLLQSRNIEILQPESGFLACGYLGMGRLCSIDKIFDAIEDSLKFSQVLKDKKIVITSGGTIEELDPVRYISNYSSGKMGFALAQTAFDMGANVVLITTKDCNVPFEIKKVKSALDMQKAVIDEFDSADCIIMAAAVADYRAKNVSQQKIKKTDSETLTLELVKNPDVLKTLGELKANSLHKPLLVGFCAESQDLIKNAREKIAKKGCDLLVANDISRSDIGFGSDSNEVLILNKSGNIQNIPKSSKRKVAIEIFDYIVKNSDMLAE